MNPFDTPVPYPAPPWRLRGEMWAALLDTEDRLTVPTGLHPLPGSHRAVLMLVRYREGTLRYDEFILGSPVRLAVRVGLWVHHIWVNDAAALWGGRRIWSVPKESAEFSWSGQEVVLTGPGGAVVELGLPGAPRAWLPLPLITSAFGQDNGRLSHFTGRLWGRVSPASIDVKRWPTGLLPALAGDKASPGLRIERFRMVLNAPRKLSMVGRG